MGNNREIGSAGGGRGGGGGKGARGNKGAVRRRTFEEVGHARTTKFETTNEVYFSPTPPKNQCCHQLVFKFYRGSVVCVCVCAYTYRHTYTLNLKACKFKLMPDLSKLLVEW